MRFTALFCLILCLAGCAGAPKFSALGPSHPTTLPDTSTQSKQLDQTLDASGKTAGDAGEAIQTIATAGKAATPTESRGVVWPFFDRLIEKGRDVFSLSATLADARRVNADLTAQRQRDADAYHAVTVENESLRKDRAEAIAAMEAANKDRDEKVAAAKENEKKANGRADAAEAEAQSAQESKLFWVSVSLAAAAGIGAAGIAYVFHSVSVAMAWGVGCFAASILCMVLSWFVHFRKEIMIGLGVTLAVAFVGFVVYEICEHRRELGKVPAAAAPPAA